MVKNAFILLLACCTLQTQAQIFAPVGSKWIYCYAVNATGGAEGYDTLVVESVAETHFDTLPCRELQVTYCYSWGNFGCGLASNITVCQKDKKIYYQEGDSLYLLHNFTLIPGDTIQIRYPLAFDTFNLMAVDSAFYANPSPRYFNIVILDTATLDLNGQAVWSQTFAEVSSNGSFRPSWYSGQFWEGIGSTAGWLFPRAINDLQEEHIPMNLVSYKGPVLGGNFMNINPFCPTTSLDVNTSKTEINVWPNPAGDILYLEFPETVSSVFIQIIDQSGKIVLKRDKTDVSILASIDITALKPGVYSVRAIFSDKENAVTKLIVF